jgi:hypothetical protein
MISTRPRNMHEQPRRPPHARGAQCVVSVAALTREDSVGLEAVSQGHTALGGDGVVAQMQGLQRRRPPYDS